MHVLEVLQGQVTPGGHASLRRPVPSSTTPPGSTHRSWRIEASPANFLGLFPAFAKLAPDHLTQLCSGCLCEVCLHWFQICHWLCLPAFTEESVSAPLLGLTEECASYCVTRVAGWKSQIKVLSEWCVVGPRCLFLCCRQTLTHCVVLPKFGCAARACGGLRDLQVSFFRCYLSCFLEARPLTGLFWTSRLGQADWQATPKSLPVSASLALGLQECTTAPEPHYPPVSGDLTQVLLLAWPVFYWLALSPVAMTWGSKEYIIPPDAYFFKEPLLMT